MLRHANRIAFGSVVFSAAFVSVPLGWYAGSSWVNATEVAQPEAELPPPERTPALPTPPEAVEEPARPPHADTQLRATVRANWLSAIVYSDGLEVPRQTTAMVPPTDYLGLPLAPELADLLDRPLVDLFDTNGDFLSEGVLEGSGIHSSNALYFLGAEAQSRAEYARAAQYFELFSAQHPERNRDDCVDGEACADAPLALETAVRLRIALGQLDKAQEGLERYRESFAETRRGRAARVSEQLSQAISERLPASERAQEYARHMDHFSRGVSPAARTVAEVRLGTMELHGGASEVRRGNSRLDRAVRRWLRRDAMEIAVAADEPQDGYGSQGAFMRSLDAVAEARFRQAELMHGRFERLTPPQYDGNHSPRSVDRFLRHSFYPWVSRKRRMLERVRTRYQEVAELGTTRWRIAAHARTGDLYMSLAFALDHAPLPDHTTETTEIEVIRVARDYRAHRAHGLGARARREFERCVDLSVRGREFGTWTRRCIDALPDSSQEIGVGPGALTEDPPSRWVQPQPIIEGAISQAAIETEPTDDESAEEKPRG